MKQNCTMRALMITCYLLIQGTSSFTLSVPTRTGMRLYAKLTDNEGSDFPFEDTEYTGSVDWDAEWKKVVTEKQKTKDRPGARYYKTEAEIAAIRAANRATEEASNLVRKVPTWNEVKGDWRVWIGILAVLSVGLSVLSAPQAPPANIGSSESYYI